MTKKKIETALVVQNSNAPDLSAVVQKLRVGPETKKTYKFAMNSFKNYCLANNVTADLTSLIQWLESVKSPSTQSTYIAAVKKVMSEVYKYDPRLIELKADLDGIRQVKRDMGIYEGSYLTKKEVDELVSISPEYLKLMIQVLFSTGLRISELLNIELEKCKLIQRKSKKSYYEISVIGKRSKENIVYVNEVLYKKVYKFFKSQKFLFENNGKQYSREHITREIKKYGALIGRSDIHAHTLRHSYATYLIKERKLTIDQVQRAMNHSNPSTTISFYLHNKPSPEDLGVI